MSWTSGFFDSIYGDRTYTAEQMSSIFEGIITPGVYINVGNKLAVQPNNGLTIQINTGRGWFGGRWVNNDAEYLLTLEDADVLLNRYAAICIRVDFTEAGRTASPYIKYSDFATAPVKPTMDRTDTVKEYCLAYVYIAAGTTEITASQIEDTRPNTDLCGWVTGIIEQFDSTALFEQFEGLFKEWLNSLEDYLDENVEAKLTEDMLELKATAPVKATGTISPDKWESQTDGTYTQVVTITGVTANNDILVAPVIEHKDAYVAMDCEAVAQGENSVTFLCDEPSETEIDVKVIIFNDEVAL